MIFNINSFTGQPEISNEPPEFEYTGNYNYLNNGDDNWEIYLLSSGMLTFTKLNNAIKGIEIFAVGGGGGGGESISTGAGGGGYTITGDYYNLEERIQYPATIGEGGLTGREGGSSQIFGIIANGGKSTTSRMGGNGGSGGGQSGTNTTAASKIGGSNGSNGGSSGSTQGGVGQGFTTRAFRDNSYPLYAGGGGGGDSGSSIYNGPGGAGGGGSAQTPGTPNTGGGGGSLAAGGSGIIIIRNKRNAVSLE